MTERSRGSALSGIAGRTITACSRNEESERPEMAGKGTPAPLLLTLDHEGSGRPFRLDREVTIIGRSPACDVVLGQDARVVSSRHARIIRRG
ncbi:MAG: FHA domain-containing protein, partial [Planctomycetaceae bacterium]|nr:FHA domain-containing protein [Planctomycetaceae bacterium]